MIITDLSMPGMDGAQLAETLIEMTPEIPIIVMTGFAEGVDTARLEEMGVAAVMRKPFGGAEVERVLEKVLGL